MLSSDGVDDAVYEKVVRLLGPREVVEVTLSASFYAAVAQFTRTLRLAHDPEPQGNT
jgi:hypothetical protein